MSQLSPPGSSQNIEDFPLTSASNSAFGVLNLSEGYLDFEETEDYYSEKR
jgi:hypothetical protein